eukprot:tig00022075_g23581.t1
MEPHADEQHVYDGTRTSSASTRGAEIRLASFSLRLDRPLSSGALVEGGGGGETDVELTLTREAAKETETRIAMRVGGQIVGYLPALVVDLFHIVEFELLRLRASVSPLSTGPLPTIDVALWGPEEHGELAAAAVSSLTSARLHAETLERAAKYRALRASNPEQPLVVWSFRAGRFRPLLERSPPPGAALVLQAGSVDAPSWDGKGSSTVGELGAPLGDAIQWLQRLRVASFTAAVPFSPEPEGDFELTVRASHWSAAAARRVLERAAAATSLPPVAAPRNAPDRFGELQRLRARLEAALALVFDALGDREERGEAGPGPGPAPPQAPAAVADPAPAPAPAAESGSSSLPTRTATASTEVAPAPALGTEHFPPKPASAAGAARPGTSGTDADRPTTAVTSISEASEPLMIGRMGHVAIG